jgi:hypothetical protein
LGAVVAVSIIPLFQDLVMFNFNYKNICNASSMLENETYSVANF